MLGIRMTWGPCRGVLMVVHMQMTSIETNTTMRQGIEAPLCNAPEREETLLGFS